MSQMHGDNFHAEGTSYTNCAAVKDTAGRLLYNFITLCQLPRVFIELFLRIVQGNSTCKFQFYL